MYLLCKYDEILHNHIADFNRTDVLKATTISMANNVLHLHFLSIIKDTICDQLASGLVAFAVGSVNG